jgi:hypothetical protein
VPYFITDQSAECDGWATIKDDGEVIGCHDSKDAAIAQMVAVSIAEGMEPGGERIGITALVPSAVGDSGVRALPENYRPALADDVPEGRACGNCVFYDESNVEGDKAWCERWDEYVDGAYYCNAWRADEDDEQGDELDERVVDLSLPEYIQMAAMRGLEYYEAGRAGDGIVERTIREARLMSRGEVSEDKVMRVSAWAARHLVDLDAPQNNDPDDDGFPGAGAVAFYLWGIDPLDPSPAIRWFDEKADQIREEERSLSVAAGGATLSLWITQ